MIDDLSALRYLRITYVLAGIACGQPQAGGVPPADIPANPKRLAAAQPHLENAALAAAEIVSGNRVCESPVPTYPVCTRDGEHLLLLADGKYGGAGSRVDALVWRAAERSPKQSITMWHFEAPGASLGYGWYHVQAISHVE